MTNQQPTNLNHEEEIDNQLKELEERLEKYEIEKEKPFRGLSHHGSLFKLKQAQRKFSELRSSTIRNMENP